MQKLVRQGVRTASKNVDSTETVVLQGTSMVINVFPVFEHITHQHNLLNV